MKIRKYNSKDFNNIRYICKKTCNDSFLLNNEDVLFCLYADYYTMYEPFNIFVATNDNDDAIGYILCSTSYETYKKIFKSSYKKRLNVKHGLYNKLALRFSLHEFKKMKKRGYSCHMHIDILPEYQHCGLGHLLVNKLKKYLKENNKDGLYLECASNNTMGNNFYKKYGFSLHHKKFGCNTYTIKLK